MRRFLPVFLTLALLSLSSAAEGQPIASPYVPTEENLRARADFQSHRLGIFLHWGIYASYAQGEWYLQTAGLNKDEYAVAAESFMPQKFDAKAWAAAFRDAGAGYVTFTSRHHDGFSMFRSAASDYNIVDAAPFGRDIVAELAEACDAAGLRFHLYYSLLDWIREDYPQGRTGLKTGRRGDSQDYGHYMEFMKAQLRELLTQYPTTGGIWFDGVWDQDENPDFDWRLPELYAFIHALKPDCLIGNNHHLFPFEGEDFQMFERDLPGENTVGYSGQGISSLPLEMCQTMNGAWGYRIADSNYKSVKELVQLLVRAAAKGSNLLLNIGPQANGELPALALDRLAGIGQWMRVHAASVDGTTATGIPEQAWGVTTCNAEALYLHILSPETLPRSGDVYLLTLPLPDGMLSSKSRGGKAHLLAAQSLLESTVSKDGFLTVRIPAGAVEDIDTVVRITR